MSSGVRSITSNGVRVYNVTASKSYPEWEALRRRRRRQLKKDAEYTSRLDLIQDFEFPGSSQRIRMTADGRHVFASGLYPPQIRCYDLAHMSLKFERRIDAEIVQFVNLSDDYRKLVLMCSDRTIEFHAQYGRHYRTRIPRHGRDMLFDDVSCELICCGEGSEVYRLQLDEGRYYSPMESTTATGFNCCTQSSFHRLIACGSENGTIECWDPRVHKSVAVHDITRQEDENATEVSSLRFSDDGMWLAAGTSNGVAMVYDIRKSSPFSSRKHQYEYPVHSLIFHASGHLCSADAKLLKIWNPNSEELFTSVEWSHMVREIAFSGIDSNRPDSGLFFAACESPKMTIHYIPLLGRAPRWSSYLDSLTEELEEAKQVTIYDNYKFVTRDDLDRLGLSHLIGTNLLKAYMHGFFMDTRLHDKALAVVEPFAFETFKKKKIQEKIDSTREERISLKGASSRPKVNALFAEKLEQAVERDIDDSLGVRVSKTLAKKKRDAAAILEDDRFRDIFEKEEFRIDPFADKDVAPRHAFLLSNMKDTESSGFQEMTPGYRNYVGDDDEEEDEEVEEDNHDGQMYEQEEPESDEDFTEESSDEESPAASQFRSSRPAPARGRMFAVENSGLSIVNALDGEHSHELAEERSKSFSERMKSSAQPPENFARGSVSFEMSNSQAQTSRSDSILNEPKRKRKKTK